MIWNQDRQQLNFAVLLILCWLAAAAQLLYMDGGMAARTLLDTDDALRLVEMRAFLAGRGWFDLHEPRLGPPFGYDSIWSRLIDAGLAGLFLAFRLVTDQERAEYLMRMVWPVAWLLPAIAAAAAIAWRIGGRDAALVLLLLVLVGMPAFQQFRPGRIDHHNVQITLALAAVAAALWADHARAAAVCGLLIGLGLTIGLESLPLLVVAGAAPALRYCVDRDTAPALRAFGLALAVSTLAGFLVGVGPDRWGRTACETMAINWMEPVVVAGLSLAMVGALVPGRSVLARCTAVAIAAIAAAVVFIALDPRCLAGPFATMEPDLEAIWRSHIHELMSLPALFIREPPDAAAVMAFPAATLIAIVVLARDEELRRNVDFLVVAGAALVAIAVTAVAVRFQSYALWIGMPLMAALIPRLWARQRLTSAAARLFVAILLTPAVVSAAGMAMAKSTGGKFAPDSARTTQNCFDTTSYAGLARLPTGLIATDADFGSFILAHTSHSALAGPYHPLARGIRAAHQVFALPPDEARRLVGDLAVDYVATCAGHFMAGVTAAERDASLWSRLATGQIPAWLDQLPPEAGGAFTVYRVRPHR